MADNWIIPTVDHLGLNSAEAAAYRESLLRSGATDRLPAVQRTVVSRIRGAIRTQRGAELDTDADTIPESALDAYAGLARYKLMAHFPGAISEPRTEEYRDAKQWLRDVAAGRILIEIPGADPDGAAPRRTRPAVSTPALTQRRQDADGL